jgi:hypothetical protein
MLRQLKQAASKAMRHYSTNITAFRVHPTLATAQYHPSRSVISMRAVPARADVMPLCQRLLRYRPTLRAGLRRVRRVYFDNLDTRTFSVMREDLKEAVPASVQHSTGETVVPGHPTDVQAFHRYQPVPVNQLLGDLVMLIAPVIRHGSVSTRHGFAGHCPPAAALAPAAHGSLLNPELTELPFERLEWSDVLPVRGGQEALNPDIDSDRIPIGVLDCHVTKIADDYHVPLVRFSLHGNRLGGSFDRPMQIHPDHTNVLQPEFVADQPRSVSTSVGKTGEPVPSLETRVSSILLGFDAPEESRECFIETAHSSLSAGEVQAGEPQVCFLLGREPRRLVHVRDRLLLGLVSSLALLKTLIPKVTVSLNGYSQFSRLVDVRLQPILECFEHLLLCFEEPVYRSAHQLGVGNPGLLGKGLKRSQLLQTEEHVNPLHRDSIHTLGGRSKRKRRAHSSVA